MCDDYDYDGGDGDDDDDGMIVVLIWCYKKKRKVGRFFNGLLQSKLQSGWITKQLYY